jgi:uncharacterized protein (TIGR03492 family)
MGIGSFPGEMSRKSPYLLAFPSLVNFRLIMNLLCISNGHGEDSIAVQVLKELKTIPGAPSLAAMPIVGKGGAYQKAGIPIVGPTQPLPSGGFIYMDKRHMMRDIQEGLLSLTRAQLSTLRQWAKQGGGILAVGDIVPLALAWLSGANYSFIGTAKSEYHLRDENGPLARPWPESWAKSVYFPWERWLMGHPRCQVAFVRDPLTAEHLQRISIAALYGGNPMMDGLEASTDVLAKLTAIFPGATALLTVALMPGSRAPEAFDNWQLILQAVEAVRGAFPQRQIRLLAAIAPTLNLAAFKDPLMDTGWTPVVSLYPTFSRDNALLVLAQDAFPECLHLADCAIATAGTATEQIVGLGKPVFTFPGQGPQFTYSFAEAQSRLLGPSVMLLANPEDTGPAMRTCLQDSQRLQHIAENGRRRMGSSGAAKQMATILHKIYSTSL